MSITITVPNDDHVALRAMAKALEEIAVARSAPAHSLQVTMGPICTVPMSPEQEEVLREKLKRMKDSETRAKAYGTDPISQVVRAAEVDTTSQQVESLAIPVEANGATYETDLGSDKPEAVCVADSTGTPWDERIHSASKALNSDGTWRLRRKPKDMDETEWLALVESVKVELQYREELKEETEKSFDDKYSPDDLIVSVASALPDVEPYAVPEDKFITVTGFADEPPITPAGDDFHVDAGELTEQQIASIPVPPLPAPPVQQSDMTFPQVMQFLTERHGRITSAQVDQIIADMGLNSIMDLNTQPEHTGPFIARVKALLGE